MTDSPRTPDDSQGRHPPEIGHPTSLLEKVCGGVAGSWDRLVALCAPVVARWCRGKGLQQADVDDVLQEVFRAVARKLADFRRDGRGSFARWLSTITRTKIVDHRRRQGKEPAAVGGSDFLREVEQVPAAESSHAGSSAEPTEEQLLVRSCLDQIRGEFKEKTWQAFSLTALEGQAVAEVAAALGMSEGAVYIARSRVFRRLREELRDLIE